jgi:hypothetical protein
VPGGPLRPWLLGTQLGVILSFGYVRLSLGRTTGRLAYAPIGACPRGATDSWANRAGSTLRFDPHELASWVKKIRWLGWYNLHVVLVTAEKFRVVAKQRLAAIHDRSLKIAEKKVDSISRLSVMPDHG